MDMVTAMATGVTRRSKSEVAPRAHACLLLLLASGALGVPVAHAEAWRFVPRVSTELSWTDNAALSDGASRRSDTVLKVTPGLSFSGRSGASFANLVASWNDEVHLRNKNLNRGDLLANGTGTWDLYERKFLVDGSINLSRQRLSLFGGTADGTAYDPKNQTVQKTFSVSPYFRWSGGGDTTGVARYKVTVGDATTAQTGRSTQHDFSASVGSGANAAPLGWQVSAQDSITFQSGLQNTRVLSTRLTGIYALDPLFRLRANTGYERNNYVASGKNSQIIFGGGFEWTPSPRTRVAAQADRRFFGNGFNIEMNWRGPRSALMASFSREVTNSTSQLGAVDMLGLFMAYQNSLKAQIPDDFERFLAAARVWQERGLPLSLGATTTYMTRSYFLERRAQLTGSLTGARNSLGLTAFLSRRKRLVDPTLLMPTDDLSRFTETQESGFTVYGSHQLSPLTSLGFTAGLNSSSGDGATGEAARHRNLSVSANTRLGPNTNSSLSYRYDASRGATQYDANTFVANLGVQF